MRKKYIYTNHVVDRLKERFKFNWDWNNKESVYLEIDEIMRETKEDRSYLNNSKFMLNLHDLHGFDNIYEFRSHVDLNILFVMIVEKGRRVVKTCYPLTRSSFIKRKGFQKQAKSKTFSTPKSRKHRAPLREHEAMEAYLERMGEDVV